MFSDIMFEHPAVTGDKTSSLSEKLMRSKVIMIGTYELQISTESVCARFYEMQILQLLMHRERKVDYKVCKSHQVQ